MNSGKKETILFLGVFLAAVFLLLAKGFSPGKLLYGLDTFSVFLPFGLFAKEAIHTYHQLPLWMPDILMGVPLIASSNLIFFYPTNLLFYLLPIPLQTTFLIDLLIHMALAALGMRLFLGKLGLDKKASIFGAFVYMFCGMFITYVYTGHWHDIKAMALLPFVMYFLNRAVTEYKLSCFFSASLFMGLQILGLGMQVMSYTFGLFSAYFLFLLFADKKPEKQRVIKMVLWFAVSVVMIILFGALQFFPSLEYLGQSWRQEFNYRDAVIMSFPLPELVSFVLPNAFGLFDPLYWGYEPSRAYSPYLGIIPFLLLFFSFGADKQRRAAVFFFVFSAVFLVLSLGSYTPFYKILSFVPVVNKFRDPSRFLTVFSFVFITVSAIGLDNILAHGARKKSAKNKLPHGFTALIMTLIPVMLFMAFVWLNKGLLLDAVSKAYLSIKHSALGAETASLYAGMIREDIAAFIVISALAVIIIYLFLLQKKAYALLFVSLLCGLHFIDVRRIDSKFIKYTGLDEFAGKDAAAELMQKDKGLYRLMDLKFLWFPNRNIYYRLDAFSGYHGVLPERFSRLLKQEAFYEFNVQRAFNIKYHLFDEELNIPGLIKILDGPVKLYEDSGAMPRIFFTSKYRKAADDNEAIEFLKSGFNADTTVVTEDMPFMSSGAEKRCAVKVLNYTPNRIRVEVEPDIDGLLILSYMYFPNWAADVDGKSVKIYHANYANMGIALKAGKHTVDFYIKTGGMVLYLFLTLAAFIICALVIFAEQKKVKKLRRKT